MTLHLISIGLFEKEDMSFKAAETARKCDILYFESYTSYYNTSIEDLEKFLGKSIKLLTRSDLEEHSKKIIDEAKKKDIGILIIGDVLSATTHNVLLLECMEKNIHYDVIHGSSIFTAIAESGLSLYKFGNTTSIPFENKDIETPYDILKENKEMHTLFLLDLNNGKYMATREAIEYLLRVEKKRKESVFGNDKLCIAFFSLGSKDSEIHVGSAESLLNINSDKKPQCLVVPGKLNFVEQDYLNTLSI